MARLFDFPSDRLPDIRGLLETHSLPYELSPARFLVVDSNRLAADVHYSARRSFRTALRESLDAGILIAFAPDRVLEEVPRTLREDYGSKPGSAIGDLLDDWEALASKLAVVPDHEIEAAGVALSCDALNERDPTDVPFVKLAMLLGAKVFTTDKDIRDTHPDLVIEDLETLNVLKRHGRDQAFGVGYPAQTTVGTTGVVMVFGAGAYEGTRHLFRLLGPHGMATLLGVAGLFWMMSPRLRAKTQSAVTLTKEVGGELLRGYVENTREANAARERAAALDAELDQAFGSPTVAQAAYGGLLRTAGPTPVQTLLSEIRVVTGSKEGDEDLLAQAQTHPRFRFSDGCCSLR